jgi:hypothetical protein
VPKKTLLVWRFVDKCVIISCGVCPENYFWIKSDERMRPMVFDLQKASMWKRISASLFDFILLAMATVGFALILSAAFGYDKYNTQLEEAYTKYETKYSIEFDISEEYMSWTLPALSLQPLIGNAVKHNTITSKCPLRVVIRVVDGVLEVENKKHAKLDVEPSTGIGLQNLRSRWQIVTGHDIEVIDSDERFIVRLPLEKTSK